MSSLPRRHGRRGCARFALFMVAVVCSPTRASATCPAGYGDVTSDGSVDVVDVQCTVQLSLGALLGQLSVPCAVAPQAADIDCTQAITVSDAVLQILLALGTPLAPELDANANQCADACEVEPALELAPAPPLGAAGCCGSVGSACAPATCGACTCSADAFCCATWDALCTAAAHTTCASSCACANASTALAFAETQQEAGIAHQFIATKQSLYGTKYWFTGGMAAEDFDNDGDIDLFALGGQAPDRLFLNDGDGTFADAAAAWGVAQPHYGVGVAAADVNGDGYVDLYVTSLASASDKALTLGRNRLYLNQGGTGFVDVAAQWGVHKVSQVDACDYGSAFGDYDLDGDLDLFVATWCVGLKSAQGNRLFRNDGASFTDVTTAALGKVYDKVWGFQPTFVDMNGDLYPEILLAADMGTSIYFANNHDGTFTDSTLAAGITMYVWGMGQSIGDFDGDGNLDWYLTSIYNPLGVVDPLTMHNGNALFLGMGNHSYKERSELYGVNDGAWGWGSTAADFDQDGWLDILTVNGRPTVPWTGHPARLFQNRQGTHFEEIAVASGLIDTSEGMASVAFDADGDGDLDAAILNNNGPLRLFRNESEHVGSWLSVRLANAGNPWVPPHGMGARVTAHAGGHAIQRVVTGEPSYLGTGPFALHFGLGHAAIVDTLEIRWSRGYVTTLTDVPVNQALTIFAPTLGDLDGDGAVTDLDAAQVALLVGEPATWDRLWADMDGDGQITLADVNHVKALLPQ